MPNYQELFEALPGLYLVLASAYLTKPIDLRRLLDVLDRQLGACGVGGAPAEIGLERV